MLWKLLYLDRHFISNSRGFRSENYSLFLTLWARSMHIENFNVLVRPWSRANDITKDEYGSCLEPICSSILYQGRTNILRMSMFLTSNLFISFSRTPFYGRSETYFWYTINEYYMFVGEIIFYHTSTFFFYYYWKM